MRRMIAALSMVISTNILSAEVAIFECKYPSASWDDVAVYAFAGAPGGSGTIAVAGVTHKSYYTVEGFIRVWRFGLDDNNGYYAFTIMPNGGATYYEVTNGASVTPKISFECRSIENHDSSDGKKPWEKYQK